MKKVTCQKCGHTWTPRVAHPQQCTKCKRYDWNWTDRKEAQIDKNGAKSIKAEK